MYHYYALSRIAQYRIDDLMDEATLRNRRAAERRDQRTRPTRRRRRTR